MPPSAISVSFSKQTDLKCDEDCRTLEMRGQSFDAWESCGLIPCFITDIFAALEQMASIKDENGQSSSFRLAASFIEVYGDDMPTYIR